MGKKSRRTKSSSGKASGRKQNGAIGGAASSVGSAIGDGGRDITSAMSNLACGDNNTGVAAISSIDEGASCWICLDEGPDENGKPLVRDCSCRGSAGYVHFSCVAEFALQKVSSQSYFPDDFEDPFDICPNCHQQYQNDLAIHLAAENNMRYVENHFPGNQMGLLVALHKRVCTYNRVGFDVKNKRQKEDCKKVANSVLSMLPTMNPKADPDGLIGGAERNALHMLSRVYMSEGTKESTEAGMIYYDKFLASCKRTGTATDVAFAERLVSNIKAYHDGGVVVEKDTEEMVMSCRQMYAGNVKKFGEGSGQGLHSGLKLADSLRSAFHTIEAERLATKLHTLSLRIHGLGHATTTKAGRCLQDCRERYLYADLHVKGNLQLFQALRYDEYGEKIVLQGPIKHPRVTNQERKISLPIDAVYVTHLGTPVTCHGLKRASHFNGKLGEARRYVKETKRFEIHFDDTKLRPVLVRAENLRLVFDLPPKSDSN